MNSYLLCFKNGQTFPIIGMREADLTRLSSNKGISIQSQANGVITLSVREPENKEPELNLDEVIDQASESTSGGITSGNYKRLGANDTNNDNMTVDFVIIGNNAFYVASLRRSNKVISDKVDLKRINIRTELIIENIDDQSAMATIERFTQGEKDKYSRFMPRDVIVGNDYIKIKDERSKSSSYFLTIPESRSKNNKISKSIDEILFTIQEVNDYIGHQMESTTDNIATRKKIALFVRSKDSVRNMFNVEYGDSQDMTKKEMISKYKEDIQRMFHRLGISAYSNMKMENSMVITKMIKSNDMQSDYEEYDNVNNTYRSFVKRQDRSLPINPSIIANCGNIISEAKGFILEQLLYIFYQSYGIEMETILVKPVLEFEPYVIAGLTENEIVDFYTNVLPNEVRSYIKEKVDMEAKRSITKIASDSGEITY